MAYAIHIIGILQEKDDDMSYRYCCAIFLLGIFLSAGCSSLGTPGYEKVYVPLNAGVKDASFLSAGEMEIFQDMIKARSGAADRSLKPLKLSRGLSFAARGRAVKIAGAGRKENAPPPRPLMERVLRYGKVKGSAAELISHGYPQRIVVDQLMRQDDVRKDERPELYFLDLQYTVAGVGCTGDFYPVCAMMFATDFEEP